MKARTTRPTTRPWRCTPPAAVVLHVIADNMHDSAAIFRVDIVGSMFATETGIRVGSTVQDFVAKYPDATCRRETYTPNPEHFDKALLWRHAGVAET